MEPLREGLPPVVGSGPRVLILGSFPSERSLALGEYYANRRNQFWRLLGAVLDFEPDLPYARRIAAVLDGGVALWDVVHSCRRVGSMDHAIERKSLVVNDFDAFLGEHRSIAAVFVNGATAFDLYEKHVTTPLPVTRLTSSSGAAASVPFADKLSQWRAIG